jgi:hypothetical protein
MPAMKDIPLHTGVRWWDHLASEDDQNTRCVTVDTVEGKRRITTSSTRPKWTGHDQPGTPGSRTPTCSRWLRPYP